MTEQQIAALIKQQQDEARAAAEERAARLQELIYARTDAPASVNLSPMAALADSMAGTKIAGGVAQQQKDADAYQGRTDDLLDQLNTLKGPKAAVPISLLQDKETPKVERQQDAQTQAAFKDLADQTRKISDSILDAGSNANKMRAAFMTKDPRQVMPAMNELARTIQDVKGSMSEGDVNRSFFTDLETRIQVALTKVGADGKLSDEAIAPVLAQLDRFQGKVAEVGKKKLDRVKTMYRGNDAYNSALGQLQSGGGFEAIESQLKDYSPKTEAAPVDAAMAAPAAATGFAGRDWKAIKAARQGKQ